MWVSARARKGLFLAGRMLLTENSAAQNVEAFHISVLIMTHVDMSFHAELPSLKFGGHTHTHTYIPVNCIHQRLPDSLPELGFLLWDDLGNRCGFSLSLSLPLPRHRAPRGN